MSHEIEINDDGTARFAYNVNGGHPWHHLGTPLHGLQTVDQMLIAAQADYEVQLMRLAAVDDNGEFIRNPDGTPILLSDSRATIRQNDDGSFDELATVGTRYVVKQNREVAERALEVVGASKGDAVVDTAGVLLGGARFFMTLDLGTLIIDPDGINDKIQRYLVISCGHDGVWPIRYANTDIRAVCNNTVMLGLKNAQRVFTARHTKNAESNVEDARTVLGMSVDWANEFRRMAEQLLAIPIHAGNIDHVINDVFNKPSASDTDRKKNNYLELNEKIRSIYHNRRNAATYGNNGWSLYNAIGEYLDHHRGGTADDRAAASIDDHSWVSKIKIGTQKSILNLP